MAILISDVDFKASSITRDEQSYFIMIRGSDTSRRRNNFKHVAHNNR